MEDTESRAGGGRRRGAGGVGEPQLFRKCRCIANDVREGRVWDAMEGRNAGMSSSPPTTSSFFMQWAERVASEVATGEAKNEPQAVLGLLAVLNRQSKSKWVSGEWMRACFVWQTFDALLGKEG